jgi:small-conductance mechanosensitive channel
VGVLLTFITGPVRDIAPVELTRFHILALEAWQVVAIGLAIVASYPVGRFGSWVLTRLGLFFARRTAPPMDDALVLAARRPLRLALGVVAFNQFIDWIELTPAFTQFIVHVSFSLLLLSFAWFAIGALRVAADWATHRAGSEGDEVATRAFRTQIILLRRLATAAIVTITIAMFLLQFEIVRNVGVSLLASAGILGIVLGLAAQKTIGAIIAGIQLSVTQPIRIGDTVFVEKDWGEIEEIKLTYVVVKLWDGRRQVIPISRFLDFPFENWTKPDSKLTGIVLLPVDFMAPLDALRDELQRLCKASTRWDGRVADLKVIDVTENTMTLRATMSGSDPDTTTALRHEVREGLITFLRGLDGGAYLPSRRINPPVTTVTERAG